jgi:ABC-2 type transport system ATP-binding protein
LEYAIEIKEVKKTYAEICAVDNVSFDVERNKVFGLVGPDGAGKTTLIRMLCGLIEPDSGSAKILGFDMQIEKNKIKNEIGYLSQKFSLYLDLSIDENIEFFAEIHGVNDYKKRRDELLEFTRLTKFRKFLGGKLSGGMKQKLALACTLIHKPKIIFLDEPTTGVDPVSRRDFWKILSELHNEGVTILISTPYMDEAERFDRIAMMNKGKILVTDTPSKIKETMKQIILEIHCSELRKVYKLLSSETKYELQLFGDRIDIAADNFETDSAKIRELLKSNNLEVSDIRVKPVSLENVFIHLLKSA